jgi:hypothetical protein
MLLGVTGYLLVSRARAPVLTPLPNGRVTTSPFPPSPRSSGVSPGLAPLLPTGRGTAPRFPPMPPRNGVVPGTAPPLFPAGRTNGGRLPPGSSPGTDSVPPVVPRVVRTVAVVDLNSAPLADLQTLPGMTLDYAQKIIAGRPYRSFREVVEHAGIPQPIVEQITPPAIIRVIERSPPSTAVPSAPHREPQP